MIAIPSLLADEGTRQVFTWGRLRGPLDWVLPLLVAAAICAFCIWIYLKESRRLGLAKSCFLIVLRLATVAGLFVLYAEPQWRTERRISRTSRAIVIADTSRSMGRQDIVGPAGAKMTRSEAITRAVEIGSLTTDLRGSHDLVVARFDVGTDRIATLKKIEPSVTALPSHIEVDTAAPPWASRVVASGAALFLLGLLGAVVAVVTSRSAWAAPIFCLGLMGLVAAGGTLAWLDLSRPRASLAVLMRWASPAENEPDSTQPEDSRQDPADGQRAEPSELAWGELLAPRGDETRLGAALRHWLDAERSSPLAGIVVLTDGGQNAGVAVESAIAMARENGVPIYAVAVGTARRSLNVRINGLVAPSRVYPGDSFPVTGYVQAEHMQGRKVTVELFSKATGEKGEPQSQGVRRIALDRQGQDVAVRFEIENDEAGQGQRTYTMKVHAPDEDANPHDNERQVVVEIVERKNRVLLLAGGPNREYRFLRTMLRRDDYTSLDALLQTAQEGSIQSVDQLLDEFPPTQPEMDQYDAVLAFDFDWRKLTADDVARLERWVAEEAGGLIVVAGPVNTPLWAGLPSSETAIDTLRRLYPVKFKRSFSAAVLADDDRFQRRDPHAIRFTRAGQAAPFLWLGDSDSASREQWAAFEGVYGYLSVAGTKPGAVVYAHCEDPEAINESGRPIYMAEQLYGAGRVFYLGSGEFWRLRAVDANYFDTLYTKLIRHVSQGRLAKGSQLGVLSVNRESTVVGKSVQVRAHLKNAQRQPLTDAQVRVQLIRPDRSGHWIDMVRDSERTGAYAGRFVAMESGVYQLRYETAAGHILSKNVDAKIPNLEREHSVLDEPKLMRLADRTGGQYYSTLDRVGGSAEQVSLAGHIPDRTETSYEPGVLDSQWEQKWMRWTMILLCGLLGLEWLLRRWWKLA